ncbi:ABC transporter substrate-binding protein [Nonomuraea sp. NPDC005650]|uniref:ABC transporter substrate-binding protein n=1 Tax=Nonomuraea sp. NPDC005650 TaxID=3157045 RepID=UPI0033A4FC83
MSARRVHRVAAAIAALLVAATACGAPVNGSGGAAPSAKAAVDPNGRLVVGTVAVPTGFDPHQERTAGERPYTFLVFDRLTKLDQSMRAQPMLATAWKFSSDGLSMTMDLRADVRFHDGTPFDATVVQANIERAKTLKGSTSANKLTAVKSVEVVSPAQVRFLLSTPSPELPQVLSGPPGAMISPKAINAQADLVKDPGLAGTGPYTVATFVPSERVVFARAAGQNWDRQAGRLAELEVRFVQDGRTRSSALRANELDVSYVDPADSSAVKEAEALGGSGQFVHQHTPSGVANALLMRSSLLKDARVRQAVVRAINRDAIVKGLLQGTCARSDQLVREGFPGHIDGFTDPYPYDPEAARRLLAEAGHGSGMDLEIFFIAGRQQIPEAVQQQLLQVGIRAQLTPLTSVEAFTAYRSDKAETWNYQITPDTSVGATLDNVLSPTGLGGQSKAVAAALTKARATLDDAGRDRAYQDAMRALADEAFFVLYCHLDAHYLTAKSVIGFDTAPLPYAQYMLDLRYVAQAKL